MAAGTSSGLQALRREPLLPPGFSCVTLREGGDAFGHACAHASELGAATLVWVRRFDLVEFAVVLEPEEPLMTARLAHYLGMNALADAMSVHAPPERPLSFNWPDALMMDLGLIGGGRTAWPVDCGPDETPRWLVFGAMLRAAAMVDPESGQRNLAVGAGVAMEELGFEDVTSVDLVESFCRHLMLGTDEWQSRGPRAVVKRWLDRLERVPGLRHGIEPNGDLSIRSQAGDEHRSLDQALAQVGWLDRDRGEPKL
jgi:Biotin/lipoate A/B protein ligase family